MAYYATYMPNELGELQKVVINAGVGFVLPYYGETAPPGTLACDGSEISREAYSELFEVLGTKAGAGDGVKTFNIPDLRNRWIVGAGDNEATTVVAEGLPNVSGFMPNTNILTGSQRWKTNKPSDEDSWSEFGGAMTTFWSTRNPVATTTGEQVDQIFPFSFDASHLSAIYGASRHVTPASVALLWCIIYE